MYLVFTFLICWASKSVPSPFLQASSSVSPRKPDKAIWFGDVAGGPGRLIGQGCDKEGGGGMGYKGKTPTGVGYEEGGHEICQVTVLPQMPPTHIRPLQRGRLRPKA